MQKLFNRYYPTKQITSKPFGSVYLAHPTDDASQQVVLKVFETAYLTSGQQGKNFFQQVQRIRKLRHSSIVPILDLGLEQGQAYVVRQYLTSNSLRQQMDCMSPQGLDLQDALKIIFQVGQVLCYAHQHQILHGNLKPENIFVTSNDEVLVSDFGITSFINMTKPQDQSDWETTGYLAPEQFVGSITQKSDQYALGCLTYELLTGHAPFSAQSFALIASLTSSDGKSINTIEETETACENRQCPDYRKVGGNNVRKFGKTRKGMQRWQCKTCRMTWSFSSTKTAPQTGLLPLSNLVPNLPKSIEDVVFKAMAKNPFDRYANISIFLNTLQIASSLPTSLSTSYPVPTVPTHLTKPVEQMPDEVPVTPPIRRHWKQIPIDYYASKTLKIPDADAHLPSKTIITSSGARHSNKDRVEAPSEGRLPQFNKPLASTLWLAFALSGIVLLLGTLALYALAPLHSPASPKFVKNIPTAQPSVPLTPTPTTQPSVPLTPTPTTQPSVQVTPIPTVRPSMQPAPKAHPSMQPAPYSPNQQRCNPFMFQPCNSPYR